MNWTTIFLIAVMLIAADKIITVMNINAVQRNNPQINALQIEKNPIAKFSFEKMGLLWGSVVYGLFSLATFYFALLLLYYPAKIFAPENPWGIALYVLIMGYALVIANNLYFLLRYNKLL